MPTRRRSRASSREFVATHPSRGWSDGVEREAHRTLLNWVGCAIGASHHADRRGGAGGRAGARAERAGDDPRPQRARRHRQRGAAERHHVAHVRLRRHAPEDDHPPGGTGRLGRARARRAPRRDAAGSSSTRSCSASTSRAASATRSIPTTTTAAGTSPARPGCSARRRRARACSASTPTQTAMALGIAASQPIGVREQFGIDDQAVPPGRRRARRPDVGADGEARLHGVGRARSRRRAAWRRRSRPSATGARSPTSSASASRSRSTRTSRSRAAS